MGFRGTATSTASYKKYGDRLQNRGVTPNTTIALRLNKTIMEFMWNK